MPNYLRSKEINTSYFFTVVTYNRFRFFDNESLTGKLIEVIKKVRVNKPFVSEAIVILPDHLHTIWTLPKNDNDYSTRWRLIKQMFTKIVISNYSSSYIPIPSSSRARKGEKLIWQRRFWEHTIRDDIDFKKHLDYIHYNPVKHGLVDNPRNWKYSSLEKWISRGEYTPDWGCADIEEIPGVEWDM